MGLVVLFVFFDKLTELTAADRFSSWQSFWSYACTAVVKQLSLIQVKRTATRKTWICVAGGPVFPLLLRDVTTSYNCRKSRK
jgi:hypothetical protein